MMKRAGAIFAIVGWVAVISGAQAEDMDRKLVPEQTFRFKANSYACLSKDKLDAAYQHAQAGEEGKMQRFFSAYQCLAMPESSDFRVLRVVDHDVEFVNVDSHDTQGLWTVDRFIKQ